MCYTGVLQRYSVKYSMKNMRIFLRRYEGNMRVKTLCRAINCSKIYETEKLFRAFIV